MTQPTSDIIEEGVREFEKDFTELYGEGDPTHTFHDYDDFLIIRDNTKSFLRSFAHRLLEAGRKEGAKEERERIAEAVKSLKVEEAPPFSADDSYRRQADLINEHLIPAIRERFLALLTLDTNQ